MQIVILLFFFYTHPTSNTVTRVSLSTIHINCQGAKTLHVYRMAEARSEHVGLTALHLDRMRESRFQHVGLTTLHVTCPSEAVAAPTYLLRYLVTYFTRLVSYLLTNLLVYLVTSRLA